MSLSLVIGLSMTTVARERISEEDDLEGAWLALEEEYVTISSTRRFKLWKHRSFRFDKLLIFRNSTWSSKTMVSIPISGNACSFFIRTEEVSSLLNFVHSVGSVENITFGVAT